MEFEWRSIEVMMKREIKNYVKKRLFCVAWALETSVRDVHNEWRCRRCNSGECERVGSCHEYIIELASICTHPKIIPIKLVPVFFIIDVNFFFVVVLKIRQNIHGAKTTLEGNAHSKFFFLIRRSNCGYGFDAIQNKEFIDWWSKLIGRKCCMKKN